jgi:hypothetical protein
LDAGKESMNTPKTKYTGDPRHFSEIPQRTQLICNALTEKLITALQDTVFGIYLYGAITFPESDHIVDIDSHVILKKPLSEAEKNEVKRGHKGLVDSFEHLTEDDLDIWYILLGDLHLPAPSHQVITNLYDTAWALHRAHMLAGYCIVLHGPEPLSVFSAPTWSELAISLDSERKSIMKLFKRYPAYCVLNACRLMYSYETKDVVISKKAAAQWAIDRFHAWREVISASIRWYAEDKRDSDKLLLESQTEPFLIFSEKRIDNSKHE